VLAGIITVIRQPTLGVHDRSLRSVEVGFAVTTVRERCGYMKSVRTEETRQTICCNHR